MIAELVNRLPLSTKISYVVRSLGLNGDDKTEVDAFIAENLSTPLVQVVTGSNIKSIEDLLGFVWTTLDEANPKTSEMMSKVGDLLGNSQLRHVLTDIFLNKVKDSPAAGAISRTLDAISQLPIPGLDRDFENEKEFIADGLLPLISQSVTAESSGVANYRGVARCPFCNQIHAIILE